MIRVMLYFSNEIMRLTEGSSFGLLQQISQWSTKAPENDGSSLSEATPQRRGERKSCILYFEGIKIANLGRDGYGVGWFFFLC